MARPALPRPAFHPGRRDHDGYQQQSLIDVQRSRHKQHDKDNRETSRRQCEFVQARTFGDAVNPLSYRKARLNYRFWQKVIPSWVGLPPTRDSRL
jgi:phenylalanyl-tRNA synthetase alpha subunit